MSRKTLKVAVVGVGAVAQVRIDVSAEVNGKSEHPLGSVRVRWQPDGRGVELRAGFEALQTKTQLVEIYSGRRLVASLAGGPDTPLTTASVPTGFGIRSAAPGSDRGPGMALSWASGTVIAIDGEAVQADEVRFIAPRARVQVGL